MFQDVVISPSVKNFLVTKEPIADVVVLAKQIEECSRACEASIRVRLTKCAAEEQRHRVTISELKQKIERLQKEYRNWQILFEEERVRSEREGKVLSTGISGLKEDLPHSPVHQCQEAPSQEVDHFQKDAVSERTPKGQLNRLLHGLQWEEKIQELFLDETLDRCSLAKAERAHRQTVAEELYKSVITVSFPRTSLGDPLPYSLWGGRGLGVEVQKKILSDTQKRLDGELSKLLKKEKEVVQLLNSLDNQMRDAQVYARRLENVQTF